MTNPVSPPNIIPVPVYPALGSPSFNQEAYTYATTMPSVTVRLHEIAVTAYTNAVTAEERSTVSVNAANTATQQADLAMGYRNAAQNASTVATSQANIATSAATSASKLNLGAKASPPTVDNQGATLQTGATYFDTTLNKWRVWNGTTWVEGISSVSGVASVNGLSGNVNLTLANLQPSPNAGTTNLDSFVESGAYYFTSPDNAPVGVENGMLIVSRAGNYVEQTAVQPTTGYAWKRGAVFSGSVPTFSIWRRLTIQNEDSVPLNGGAIDCSKGEYFTEVVSDNRTLSFTNEPSKPYSCVVELLHNSGTITPPSNAVWANGVTPELASGKRHLIYFQRSMTGSGGWIMSALPGSAQ